MLTIAELTNILTTGPGSNAEILSPALATAERMAQSMVAFANGQGGYLIVRLDRLPSDVHPDAIRDHASQAMLASEPHLIVPLPYVLPASPAAPVALVIEIPSGLPHIYGLDGRYYMRDGTHNSILPAKSLRNLLLTRSEGTWEAMQPPGSNLDDMDWSKAIAAYASRMGSEDLPAVQNLLVHRGCLVRRGKGFRPTSAGLLLFGIDPQSWVRGAEVLAVRYAGTTIGDIFTRQAITGRLPDQIRQAEMFVADNLSRQAKVKEGWQREEEMAYPSSMLREAIVNAIAHRDYRITGNQVLLLMFGDRIEVHSPGRLPGHVTLANFVHERYSRNEAIMQVLCDMGFVERLGHGIDRILSAAKECELPTPEFRETDAGFVVSLYCRPATAANTSAPEKRLLMAQNQRIEKMMAFIKVKGQITSREYQELCPGITAESLRRDFTEMVEQGLILRVGDKRGTYYISKKAVNNQATGT
jgi:ATP-dependent DNA helicase RecG